MKKENETKEALAKELFLQGKKYQEIADEVGVTLSAVKSWATRYWKPEKLQPETKKVATKKSRGGQPGNKNATGPPGNKHAERHGLFSRILPAETLALVESIDALDPLDILWQNIQIQYAAILRAQQIMYVKDIEDKTIEKVEEKYGKVSGESWEVQQAWDKQANFLAAQSRAMTTLNSLLKQYDAMVADGLANQEQRARINLLKAQIKKIDSESPESGKGSKVVIVDDLDKYIKAENSET